MRSRPVLTIAVTSLMVAACGGGSEDADPTIPEITLITTTTEAPLFEPDEEPVATDPVVVEESTTTVAEVATTTAPEVATTIAPEPTPAPETTPVETAPPPPGGEFVLGADGLGAVPFGADPEQTITFISSVVGSPTFDTGWVDPFEIGPCGGTRLRQVSWNQLQLEFGDVSGITEGRDHFYAFFYGAEGSSTPQPPGLKTETKIGAGSSVAELIAAYPGVTLLQGDEFIGPSFRVNDNLSGRMSGLADDDVVEAIVGGRPCDG